MPKRKQRHNWSALKKELSLSLPSPLVGIYISRLQHWEEHKGPEWVSKRIKAIWNIALILKSGNLMQLDKVYQESFIAREGLYPKGIEGILVRNFVTSRRPSVERRSAAMLRTYTGIFLQELTHTQLEKARKSICTPGKQPVLYTKLERQTQFTDKGKTFQPGLISVHELTKYSPKPGEITLPTLGVLSGVSSYPSLYQPSNWLRKVKVTRNDTRGNRETLMVPRPYLSMASSLMTKGVVPQVLLDHLGDFSSRQYAQDVQEESGDLTYGKINVIQEGGSKARVVCSPNAWVQYYCYPYHRYLSRVISDIESNPDEYHGRSCMFDQLSGAYIIIRKLEEGSYVSCIDLSSATDRFPLSVQQKVCQMLGIPEYASALDDLKGPYIGLDGKEWTYAQGQPMGLLGSFPLFHLSHFLLLQGLSNQLGLTGTEEFCVLGDDVVIFNPDLEKRYRACLDSMSVDISENKSYSGNLAEFAGFIITRNSDGKVNAFRPYKHARDFEFSSVMNVLHAFGSDTSSWSNSWKKSYDAYAKTTGLRSLDLSPLIAKDEQVNSEREYLDSWILSTLEIVSRDPKSRFFSPADFMSCWEEDFENMLREHSSIDAFSSSDMNGVYNGFDPYKYYQKEMERRKMFSNFFRENTIVQIRPELDEISA